MPSPSQSPPAPPPAPPTTPASAVFSARIGAHGAAFEAPAALTLLQAAERAGVTLESSCRNGTCRHCIRQLASGQVSYRIAWPGLSFDEKREGCILPCVAYPASDVVIAEPPP